MCLSVSIHRHLILRDSKELKNEHFIPLSDSCCETEATEALSSQFYSHGCKFLYE